MATRYTVKVKQDGEWYTGGVFYDKNAAYNLEGQFGEMGVIAYVEEAHIETEQEHAERKLAEAERAERAKRKLDKLIDRIEDMKLDCDAEVYEELLKVADILGR